MKTLYVHPIVMERIKSGNMFPIVTRYEVEVGEEIEVESDDEANTVRTKVKSVKRKGSSLFVVEIEDPATAFRKEVPDGE